MEILKHVYGIDACLFEIVNAVPRLLVYLPEPTRDEVDDIGTSPYEIRITMVPQGLWFTFRFGKLGWMEAPYAPAITEQKEIEALFKTDGCNMQCILVDSETNKIAATRTIEWNQVFFEAFKKEVIRLRRADFNERQYRQMLQLFQRVLTVKEIADKAVVRSFSYDWAVPHMLFPLHD